jgi:hypothetical protein
LPLAACGEALGFDSFACFAGAFAMIDSPFWLELVSAVTGLLRSYSGDC